MPVGGAQVLPRLEAGIARTGAKQSIIGEIGSLLLGDGCRRIEIAWRSVVLPTETFSTATAAHVTTQNAAHAKKKASAYTHTTQNPQKTLRAILPTAMRDFMIHAVFRSIALGVIGKGAGQVIEVLATAIIGTPTVVGVAGFKIKLMNQRRAHAIPE